MPRGSNFIDMVGFRSGEVLVLTRGTKRPGSSFVRWVCRCDCGTEFETSGADLRNGKTKSCGCARRRHIAALNLDGRAWRTPRDASTLPGRLAARSIPEPNSGCLLWEGGVNEHGYGTVSVAGTQMLAHRAAWLVAHGEIPAGMQVLHRCDTPACISPAHLFLGTHSDNMLDKAAKGRCAIPNFRGESHPTSKLSEEQVRQIVTRLLSGDLQTAIARDFNVSLGAIEGISQGKKWRHVTGWTPGRKTVRVRRAATKSEARA
jgi:hypothetical protein